MVSFKLTTLFVATAFSLGAYAAVAQGVPGDAGLAGGKAPKGKAPKLTDMASGEEIPLGRKASGKAGNGGLGMGATKGPKGGKVPAASEGDEDLDSEELPEDDVGMDEEDPEMGTPAPKGRKAGKSMGIKSASLKGSKVKATEAELDDAEVSLDDPEVGSEDAEAMLDDDEEA
ncbi:hypothetical protein RSOL_312150, partial [Rhizoctonia solani AG-3 Rhs1AP]